MNGIDLNIIAYSFIMLMCFKNMVIYYNKSMYLMVAINIIVFLWSLYFGNYLINEYIQLQENPFNIELNKKEVITNILIVVYLGISTKRSEQ